MATTSCTPFYDGGKRRNSVCNHMTWSLMTEKLPFLQYAAAQRLKYPGRGKLFPCLEPEIYLKKEAK